MFKEDEATKKLAIMYYALDKLLTFINYLLRVRCSMHLEARKCYYCVINFSRCCRKVEKFCLFETYCHEYIRSYIVLFVGASCAIFLYTVSVSSVQKKVLVILDDFLNPPLHKNHTVLQLVSHEITVQYRSWICGEGAR